MAWITAILILKGKEVGINASGYDIMTSPFTVIFDILKSMILYSWGKVEHPFRAKRKKIEPLLWNYFFSGLYLRSLILSKHS